MNENSQTPVLLLGQCVITPGAQQALQSLNTLPQTLLDRHQSGDWGTLGSYHTTTYTPREWDDGMFATDDGGKLNKIAVDKHSGNVTSIYELGEQTVWIETAQDRRVTTVYLPDEA